MSDGFDQQKESIDKIIKELKRLKDENISLKQRVQSIEDRLSLKEQQEKAKNILVVGIPKQEQGPKNIIKKVISTMKIQVDENEIEEARRVNQTEDAPILVKFKNQEKKQIIMKTIRQLKGIKVKECGLAGIDRNIYLNDDLTQHNQLLFKTARSLKKSKKIKAAYTFNGRIYIKKDENDAPIRIRKEEDLNL